MGLLFLRLHTHCTVHKMSQFETNYAKNTVVIEPHSNRSQGRAIVDIVKEMMHSVLIQY